MQQDSVLLLSLNLLCNSLKEVKKTIWGLLPAIMLFFTEPAVFSAGQPWTCNFSSSKAAPFLVKVLICPKIQN